MKKQAFNKMSYDNEYRKTHYITINVQFKRDNDTFDRLENMQIMTGKSRNAIILDAIKEYLDRHYK